MIRKSLFVFIILFFFCSSSNAWWSVGMGNSTHRLITYDSIAEISQSEYPDVWQFVENIQSGSETESHNIETERTEPLDNTLNGGYPQAWWNNGYKDAAKTIPDNAVYYYKCKVAGSFDPIVATNFDPARGPRFCITF